MRRGFCDVRRASHRRSGPYSPAGVRGQPPLRLRFFFLEAKPASKSLGPSASPVNVGVDHKRPSRLELFVVICVLFFSLPAFAQAPATQPRPSFGVLLSPGIAPCAIHADGLRFTLSAGTPLTAQYDWDFGDPRGRFDHLQGFNAAHIYDQPGRYTIRLTVTDETGHADSATAAIVISPDDRRRIYVSPEGSDSNTGLTPDAPFRSLGKAFKVVKDNCEILLRATGKYETTGALSVNHHNILIGRYDNGTDPVLIRNKGSGSMALGTENHCDGVTIEHITFQSPYAAEANGSAPKVGVSAIRVGGRNITVRNCSFMNLDDAVNANGSPHGLLVEDCTSPSVTGLRGYFLWAQGSDIVVLGNSVANSTREHNVRATGVQRMLVADNTFANLDRRPADPNDESKGCIEMHRGSDFYIVHNSVTSGPIRTGPLGLNEEATSATDWVVIDGNTVEGTKIFVNSGSHHIMIRNNIVRNEHDQAVTISGPDKQGRTSGDLSIINNTDINVSDSGSFLRLWGHADGIILKNNLFVAPALKPGANGTAIVNTVENDLSSFTEIERNLWPLPTVFGPETKDGVCIVGTTTGNNYRNPAAWSAFPQVKEDRFVEVSVDEHGAPPADSPAVGYALPTPGLRQDHDGKPRSPQTPTAGAIEVSAEPATQQTLQNDAK